jgi:hypothetical protein
VVFGIATAVQAAIPDAQGVIHGCYNSQGALRVIDSASATCKSSETALNWNQRGIPGPTGAKGDQGIQGPSGPKGATGQKGATGSAGSLSTYTNSTVTSIPAGTVNGTSVMCNGSDVPTGGGAAVQYTGMNFTGSYPLGSGAPGGIEGWQAYVDNTTASAGNLTVWVVCER